jgi:hypothetical protein
MGQGTFIRILAIVLSALAMAAGLSHLFSLANKMALSGPDYFVAQRAYDGWALLGIVQVAAIAATVWLAASLDPRAGRLGAWLGASLMVAGLIVFFGWIFPANRATSNWTIQPEHWADLRRQWEVGHAINAILYLIAFCAVVWSALRPDRLRAG